MNNDEKLLETTIALAAIFQAASLVRDLAKNGRADEVAFETIINSIYKINADNVPAVYNGISGLKLGLTELHRLLTNSQATPDASFSRYIVSIFHLERKLRTKKDLQGTLARRIKHAVSQANYFSVTHPTVINSLADIYINTLGTLKFRIQILGQVKYLNQQDIIYKIRAILLAGVRSAVLWRQKGGKRWQLFLWRNKIAKLSKKLLDQC